MSVIVVRTELQALKQDQLRKIMCSYAAEVPVADSKFFPVFCLGPGLSSASPHSKSKLNLKHRSARACSDTTKDNPFCLEIPFRRSSSVLEPSQLICKCIYISLELLYFNIYIFFIIYCNFRILVCAFKSRPL